MTDALAIHRVDFDEFDDIDKRIDDKIARALLNRLPFQAEVFDVSQDPLIQIKRYGATQEDAQRYPSLLHLPYEVGDKVLCLPTDGVVPVIIGKVDPEGDTLLGMTITVQEGDTTRDSAVTTLDFDASDFNVTSSPAGEANIALAYGTTAGTPAEGNHTHAVVPDEWQRGMVTKSLIADTQSTTPLLVGITGYTPTADVLDDQMDSNAAGAWLLHNSAASTNAEAGWALTDAFRTNWFPGWLTFRFQSGATLTNARIWIGAFSATPMASADPAVHGAGFRYDTSAGSVNWWAWSNDGSGGGTLTNTGVTLAAQTAYTLTIEVVSASSVRFYINGSLVATHSTNLPGTTTSLFPRCMVRTLNAAVKSVRWAWFHMQHT